MTQKIKPATLRAYLLTLPSGVIIVTFFLLPLAWIIILSFSTPTDSGTVLPEATLSNYVRFLSDRHYLVDLLWRTVRLSLIATVIAVLIGYAGAMAIARANQKWRPILMFMNLCPLWVNLVVRTLSLMIVLGRDGPINKALLALGVVKQPLQLLFNETAVVVGMVQVSVPFVILSLYAVLQTIPRELEYAAMSVGATPWATFRRVTLPLSVPGIMAGSILALGINMESFVVPILLGGGRVQFMSIAAFEMATVSDNLPFAATIGMVLLAVTLSMLVIYQWLVGRMARAPSALPVAT
jgi:putative spermidine/putrescine transport system permease protein